jgi:ADP-ribose pyrophosphatase YjhB (NUDIX family)
MTTYTHPDVLGRGVTEGWADPITDPREIDWARRQAAAVIPFKVVDGRPINPCQKTGIEHGRNELGHWGEQVCADAFVTAEDRHGHRWLVMVERGDGYGWALPGGTREGHEDVLNTASRELAEETGLTADVLYAVIEATTSEEDVDMVWESAWRVLAARYVPDPRASDEAWMVSVPVRIHLGVLDRAAFPVPVGADDAARAEWVRADSYAVMVASLEETYGGRVFAAHEAMLSDLLG